MASDSTSESSFNQDTASIPFEKNSRSLVWKYFKRDKTSAGCSFCLKHDSYNGGTTSNLMPHLERKHTSLIKHEIKEVSNTTQITLNTFTKLNVI